MYVWHLAPSKNQAVEYQYHKMADMPLSTLKQEMYVFISRTFIFQLYYSRSIVLFPNIVG